MLNCIAARAVELNIMIKLFKQYLSPRKIIFVTGEGILIFLAVTLASYILYGRELGIQNMLEQIWPKVFLIAFITQISMYHNDLYEINAIDNSIELAYKLIQSIGITSIVLAILYLLLPDLIIAKWVFFANLVFLLFFLVCWRLTYSYILRRKLLTEKTILLGSGELAKNILNEIKDKRDLSYNVTSVIVREKDKGDEIQNKGIDVHYGFDSICDLVDAHAAGNVIVALDEKRGVFPYDELLACKIRGINIIDGESFYERITGKLLVERINPSWLIFSDGFVKSRISRFSKRLVGLLTASLFLIICLPLALLVALFIKCDSRGPILFKQERVGENEKPFTLYKFRSMKADAEEQTGPIWAGEDDPRVTKVGRIIRKLRIDEIPQLWNVFKGDMSFVGPRPERPFFVEQLKNKIPYYNERASVKPGITGWAQIKYPYGATEKDALEKLKYDLYYIKNMSIVIDMMIIFHTVKTVLLGRGAR